MQHLQPLLETIGFNHQESALYLHVLSAGEQPASKIATATRIPRSTVRGILDALCTAGLLGKVYKRNTQYYSCKPPSHLVKYLEQKMNATKDAMASVKEALPLFDALRTNRAVVPKVQVFEGPEQIVEAFNHSLYTDGIEEILFVTSFRFLRDPVIRKNDADFYVPRRIKKGIRMRVLVGHAEERDKPAANDKAELRERRVLASRHVFPGNFHVYGNFVVYFSAGDSEYLAVLIESPMMAETMRALFNVLWER